MSRKPKPKAPGRYVTDAERHTDRLTLRMDPEIVEMLRESAEREEMTLAEYVSHLESEHRLDARVARAYRGLDPAGEKAVAIKLWREEKEGEENKV